MNKEIPFSDDVMTLIMGVTPETPGQHGRVMVPAPTKDAVSIITQIKDLCEEFLSTCGEQDKSESDDNDSEFKPDEKNTDEKEEDE